MGEGLDKAPIIITGTARSHGISTRIITIKMVSAWALVILGILTQDSRQATIKVIMASSMTIAAITSDVAGDVAAAIMAATAEEATSTMACPTTKVKGMVKGSTHSKVATATQARVRSKRTQTANPVVLIDPRTILSLMRTTAKTTQDKKARLPVPHRINPATHHLVIP